MIIFISIYIVRPEPTYNNREFQLQHPVFPSIILPDIIICFHASSETFTQTNTVLLSGACYAVMGTAVGVETKQEGRRCWTPRTDYWAELAEWSHVSCLISRPCTAMRRHRDTVTKWSSWKRERCSTSQQWKNPWCFNKILTLFSDFTSSVTKSQTSKHIYSSITASTSETHFVQFVTLETAQEKIGVGTMCWFIN